MNEILFGYCFTDFQSRMREGGIYILKSLSLIINHPVYGGLIFDTGSPTDNGTLLAKAAELGLSANDVKWIFGTHVHPDHFGGNTIFPKATIVLSKRDYEFSVGIAEVALSGGNLLKYLLDNCPGYRNSYDEFEAEATRTYIKDYWSPEKIGLNRTHLFIEDNPKLPHFVKPIFTPGHTFYHYAYELALCDKPVYVTGDAVSNRLILTEDNKYRMNEPHMDFDLYFKSRDFFCNKNALLIPGHDRPFFTDTFKTIRKSTFTLDSITNA